MEPGRQQAMSMITSGCAASIPPQDSEHGRRAPMAVFLLDLFKLI